MCFRIIFFLLQIISENIVAKGEVSGLTLKIITLIISENIVAKGKVSGLTIFSFHLNVFMSLFISETFRLDVPMCLVVC